MKLQNMLIFTVFIIVLVALHLLERNGFSDFDHASPAAIEQYNAR